MKLISEFEKTKKIMANEEKYEEQIAELEKQKISRQKNQCTEEYKSHLKQRRLFDDQIKLLEEQKSIVSDSSMSIEEWKEKFNNEYNNQMEKLESDKSIMTKRTYNKNKENLTKRNLDRLEALETLKIELKIFGREQIEEELNEKIQKLKEQRQENEEEINVLKNNNEIRNLKIDKEIYMRNKEQVQIVETEINELKQEIEAQEKELESLVNDENLQDDLEAKIQITYLKKNIGKMNELVQTYSEYKEKLESRNNKFTKKTLEKISQIQLPSENPEKEIKDNEKATHIEANASRNEETAHIETNASKNTKPTYVEEKTSETDVLTEENAKDNSDEVVENNENKKETETNTGVIENMPDEICVRPLIDTCAYLSYKTLKDDKEVAGRRMYCYKSGKKEQKRGLYDYKGIVEGLKDELHLTDKDFENIDPFLLDYLSCTNIKLYNDAVKEIKEGRGLEKYKGIVKYDMSDARFLKGGDKKLAQKIALIAKANGMEVIGFEDALTLGGKIKVSISETFKSLFAKKSTDNQNNAESHDTRSAHEEFVSKNSLPVRGYRRVAFNRNNNVKANGRQMEKGA